MQDYCLYIAPSLIKSMFDYASLEQIEICGVLIGRKIDAYQWNITNIVYDDKSLQKLRYGVVRNTRNLYPKVKKIVENLEYFEKSDFIGDWHSHLIHSTMYSNVDSKSMRDMLKDKDYFFLNEIILLIICFPDLLDAYIFHRTKKDVEKMIIISQDFIGRS